MLCTGRAEGGWKVTGRCNTYPPNTWWGARGSRVILDDLPPSLPVVVGTASTDAEVDDEGTDDAFDG